MRIGIDIDDVIAECAVPYLRRFAEEFKVDLPAEPGWHTLTEIGVPQEDKDRFRIRIYDSDFFGSLEPYADCPIVLEQLVEAGHELYFVTARAEKRRVVTETWLREKGLFDHARAVHLKPAGDFDPTRPSGRYDPQSSARYKVRLAQELELERFCEDDNTISRALAEAGIRVWLFDHPWNRDVQHPNIERVSGWSEIAEKVGLPSSRSALTGRRAETTLYLVRHGESEANAAGRFAGQTDSPLTDLGRRQAEVVAEALRDVPFDRVASSDLSRARETAEAIARRHGLRVEVFPELREIDVGEAAGRAFEDLRQRPDWTPEGFVQWPGGESLEAALERTGTLIDRLAAEGPGKRICVVGHGGTTRIMVSHFLGLLPKLYRHPTPSANTNITVVHTDGITYRVESLFEAGHLAERPPSPEERAAEAGATGDEGAI